MEQNTLFWDREAYTPRRGAYPHYYELIMEAVRSNPCISLPLDVLNKGFYFVNMCNLITHSLALYTIENTQKNFKIPFSSIFVRISRLNSSRKNELREISENKKFRQKLSRLSHNCFASKAYPQQVLCFKDIFSRVTFARR